MVSVVSSRPDIILVVPDRSKLAFRLGDSLEVLPQNWHAFCSRPLRHPEIASQFYEAAFGHGLAFVEALIERALRGRALQSPLSAMELAKQLVGMWEGIPMVRGHLGFTQTPYPNAEDWARKCVATLLPEQEGN